MQGAPDKGVADGRTRPPGARLGPMLSLLLHGIVRVGLLGSLVAGLFLLIFGFLPLPGMINSWLNRALESEELIWTSERILYRFPRTLEWREGALASTAFPNHPMAEVRVLRGQLAPRWPLDWASLQADGLTWQSIAPRSPTGRADPLLELEQVILENDPDRERFTGRLSGAAAGVRLDARTEIARTGIAPLRETITARLPAPPTPRTTPLGRLLPDLNARAATLLAELPERRETALELFLRLEDTGTLAGRAELLLPVIRDPDGRWEAREVRQSLTIASTGELPLAITSLNLEGRNVQGPYFSADHFFLAHPEPYPWRYPPQLPERFTFSLSDLRIDDALAVASVRGSFHHRPGEFAVMQLGLYDPDDLALTGNLRWLGGERWTGNLRGDWQPNLILRHPILAALMPDHRGLTDFREPVFADLAITAEGFRNWESLRGFVRAHNFTVVGTTFDSIEGEILLNPERAEANRLYGRRKDFSATGRAVVIPATRTWRLSLEGSHRPMHIASWFTSWWTNFWSPFDFSGPAAEASVDIQGWLDDPDATTVFGGVTARSFSFRGYPLDRLTTVFATGDGQLSFRFPRAEIEDEWASGHLRVNLDEPRKEVEEMNYVFSGQARPARILAFINPTWKRYGNFLTLPSPPLLTTTGQWNRRGGDFRPERLQLHLWGEGEWQLGDLILREADLEAQWAEETLFARLIDSRHTSEEGELRADLTVRNIHSANGARMDLALDLEDLRAEEFLPQTDRMIRQLTGLFGPPAEKEEESGAEPWIPAKGLLDGRLRLTGRPIGPETYDGEGVILLREGEIASVRLLGILSRILDLTPIRVTTVNLDEIESRFTIREGMVQLDPLLLRGPVSGIEANGTYHLPSGQMDVLARVILLSETGIPLITPIFRGITRPFGHIMEVRLTGSPDQPDWRLMIDPRNIFAPREEPFYGPRASEPEGNE